MRNSLFCKSSNEEARSEEQRSSHVFGASRLRHHRHSLIGLRPQPCGPNRCVLCVGKTWLGMATYTAVNPRHVPLNHGFSTGALDPLWGSRSGFPGSTSRGLY